MNDKYKEREEQIKRESKIELWLLLTKFSKLNEKTLKDIFGIDVFTIEDILKNYSYKDAIELYEKYINNIHPGDVLKDTSNNDQYYVLYAEEHMVYGIKIFDNPINIRSNVSIGEIKYLNISSPHFIKTDIHYDYIHFDNKIGTVQYGNI